jgi:hypothetical protein
LIAALPTIQSVPAATTVNLVAAAPAIDEIWARATQKEVASAESVDAVAASAATDDICFRRPSQYIATPGPLNVTGLATARGREGPGDDDEAQHGDESELVHYSSTTPHPHDGFLGIRKSFLAKAFRYLPIGLRSLAESAER